MFWFTILLWNPLWTPTLISNIESNLAVLESAKDIQDYCPSYNMLSHEDRIGMWVTFSQTIVGFESDFDPNNVTYEPQLGFDSIGLFQLSPEDKMPWCDEDHLKDPAVNIKCAFGEFAHLIEQDHVIASGGSAAFHKGQAKGLSRYWSTLWPKPDFGGHRVEIQQSTRDYCAQAVLANH